MKKETVLKFYSTYKLYIFPAAVLTSCLILISFVIYPQLAGLISDSKTAAELQRKMDFLEVKAQTLAEYDEEDLSSKLDYALDYFPADKDFTNALGILQNITSQSSFAILSFALGTQTAVTGAQGYSVKLEVKGPKVLLPDLLSGIESSHRVMRVVTLEVKSSPGGSADVFLGIDVLYSSAPQTFGSTDSPLPDLTEEDEQLLSKLAREGVIQRQPASAAPTVPLGKSDPFE